ncbi:MAG TPA: hypothetical protein VJH70_02530 [Candidatus Paceibacterota bacterium]
MQYQKAFIKLSGDLLEPTDNEEVREDLIEKIQEINQQYLSTVCVGGGTQINRMFKMHGYPILFGPLGREFNCQEAKDLAEKILEQNRVTLDRALIARNIAATVIVPMLFIGESHCHVNGDRILLDAYHGFDRLFLFTLTERIEKKEEEFRQYRDFNSRKLQFFGFPRLKDLPAI